MGKMENEIASQLSCGRFKQIVKMQFDIIYIYILFLFAPCCRSSIFDFKFTEYDVSSC